MPYHRRTITVYGVLTFCVAHISTLRIYFSKKFVPLLEKPSLVCGGAKKLELNENLCTSQSVEKNHFTISIEHVCHTTYVVWQRVYYTLYHGVYFLLLRKSVTVESIDDGDNYLHHRELFEPVSSCLTAHLLPHHPLYSATTYM